MSDLALASAALRRVVDNVERVIAGARPAVEAAVVCLFADGNLLLEGVPGVGKTMLARALAVGAARTDGGATGERRGRDARAPPSVPADRDREPDRAARHLPAARGPARPVLDDRPRRLSGECCRRRDRAAADGPARDRGPR